MSRESTLLQLASQCPWSGRFSWTEIIEGPDGQYDPSTTTVKLEGVVERMFTKLLTGKWAVMKLDDGTRVEVQTKNLSRVTESL